MAILPNWMAGFKLDDREERKRIEALRREHPSTAGLDFSRLDANTKAALDEYIQRNHGGGRETPDTGPLRYLRYTNPDDGRIVHVPQGDSAGFFARHSSPGFRGGIARIKVIDGHPRLVSSLKARTTYE